MSETDPRLATMARSLQARLAMDKSLGARFLPVRRASREDLDALRQTAPTEPANAWSEGGEARPPEPDASVPQEAAAPAAIAEASPSPAGRAGEGMGVSDKEARLAPVREEALGCTRCRLCESRTQVVFGEGSADADVVFVGEAPGRDEDEQGRPFVGKAGKMLTRMIENVLGVPREAVYICNVLKCRPPQNRDPRPDEIMACRSYLEAQLDILAPRVIVTLGRFAATVLIGQDLAMGKMRGRWFDHRGVPVLPMYHPAYLIRQRDAEGGPTDADRKTLADLNLVKAKMEQSHA